MQKYHSGWIEHQKNVYAYLYIFYLRKCIFIGSSDNCRPKKNFTYLHTNTAISFWTCLQKSSFFIVIPLFLVLICSFTRVVFIFARNRHISHLYYIIDLVPVLMICMQLSSKQYCCCSHFKYILRCNKCVLANYQHACVRV